MVKKEEQNKSQNGSNEKQNSLQLEKKIQELQKANEEIIRLKNVEKFESAGRMARTIAHEIRNPLTNISLALEQLNAELPHNDDVTLLVEMISRNTMRINGLITDLLDSTKFAQLDFSDVFINELLDEAIAQIRHLAKHKHIQIEEHFSNQLPTLLVDSEKIKTAFENLLTHVIESVQSGTGKITIRTENQNNKCVISIHNDGAVMNKEKLDRLFEPRFTDKQGTGLALTHAQNIILNHGGSIYAESEPNKGTTFTIILSFV